ncbi:carcinoembryonic antigen-related cell adhesion molecule 6-like [Hyperolius riggenbachi]|uniref:carcinoembryonic antigen-related cell adhesion molecule 6-like n=1 Tax=Hyperolius riggenbachi TaxID=752182 RepID=UPI0035A392A0
MIMEAHSCWQLWILVCVTLAPASATTTLTSNTTGPLVVGRDSVALICTTQLPNPDYFWNLDGQALPGDSRYHVTTVLSKANATLTISPVFMNDTGNFTCEAISGSTTEISNVLRLNLTNSTVSSSTDSTVSSSTASTVSSSTASTGSTRTTSGSSALSSRLSSGAITNFMIVVAAGVALIIMGIPS